MVKGGKKMTRYECENQIIEKLKEIKDIAKQYDTSESIYLNLTISLSNDYCLQANNRYWETEETPINVSIINGKVIHYDN